MSLCAYLTFSGKEPHATLLVEGKCEQLDPAVDRLAGIKHGVNGVTAVYMYTAIRQIMQQNVATAAKTEAAITIVAQVA